MKDIDQTVIALIAYVVFSGLFSLIYSSFASTSTQTVTVQKPEPVTSEAKKSKKQKLINTGYEAICNVCERSFDNDTYLKNHLEGQKHKKKAATFEGEVYRIAKIQDKKK